MTNRWRALPDGIPRLTVPALWCLTVFAMIVLGGGAVGLNIEFPRAARETEFLLTAVIGMAMPILAVSSWGLVVRRFAFGSAWIAATLATAALMSGGFATLVAVHARGKDSIGHGLILLFGTPLLFLALIVASSILYGVYWKRRFSRASQRSQATIADRSLP